MTRVLHITRDYPPKGSGGISTAVSGVARHSKKAGLEVQVVSFDGWRPRGASTGGELGLDDGGTYRLSSPGELEAACEFACAISPDVVHVHDPLLWEFGHSVAERSGASTVVTFHVMHCAMNELRGLNKDTLSSSSERRAAEQADILHVTTSWVASEIRSWGEGFADRVRLAPLGIDDSIGARKSRESPKEGPVLYVGRFSDVKGTDTFIEALKYAGSELGDVRVVGGLPHNKKREERWINRLKEAAPNRLECLGWLDDESLSRCYAEATMLVVPSRIETYGLVALEGLLHGVPVLASGCAAFRDWLEPADAAQFYETEDAKDLALQMIALRRSDLQRERLSRRGSNHALSEALWLKRATSILELYAGP